jgi:hypothetical protein
LCASTDLWMHLLQKTYTIRAMFSTSFYLSTKIGVTRCITMLIFVPLYLEQKRFRSIIIPLSYRSKSRLSRIKLPVFLVINEIIINGTYGLPRSFFLLYQRARYHKMFWIDPSVILMVQRYTFILIKKTLDESTLHNLN